MQPDDEAYIEWDLSSVPLEVKTNSVLQSLDNVVVSFFSAREEDVGKVRIIFGETLKYNLNHCTDFPLNFPTTPPSDADKVWRITLTKSADIRLVIHCNEVEVLNKLLSDTTCDWRRWRDIWGKHVAKIRFSSDTASDYYGPSKYAFLTRPISIIITVGISIWYHTNVNTNSNSEKGNNKNHLQVDIADSCIGLKAEWTSTIETTKQFPVLSGTVVKVTCSDSGAFNKGSSEVTCKSGNVFTFVTEPSCPKPGKNMNIINAMQELKLVY